MVNQECEQIFQRLKKDLTPVKIRGQVLEIFGIVNKGINDGNITTLQETIDKAKFDFDVYPTARWIKNSPVKQLLAIRNLMKALDRPELLYEGFVQRQKNIYHTIKELQVDYAYVLMDKQAVAEREAKILAVEGY